MTRTVESRDETEASQQTPGIPSSGNGIARSSGLAVAYTDRREKPPPVEKVIKFSAVSKRFILHHERPRTFQELVVSLFGLRTPSRRGLPMPKPPREAFWALRDVSFGVYPGELLGVIGENGSGKSTTLKLISRILSPTYGTISVRGKVSALLELGTGFHPELSGRENIFLNGSLLGIPRREMAHRYPDIVSFAEIADFIDAPIKHYSSGMVMRLGFAVAIHVDPDILLTDEVLAVGDEAFQRKCLDHIAALRQRGVTIIFVSHALEAVRSLCKRVIWLDHGRIVADGPAGEVIDRYLTYENAKHAERIKDEGNRMRDEEKEEEAMKGEIDPNLFPLSLIPHPFQITGVDFLDAQGQTSTLFSTGQPLTIRIKYNAEQRLESPVFGLALYTENGTHINGPNTNFSGLHIPAIEGTGSVAYTIQQLPLLTGRYSVTVALTGPDTTQVYDHQHQAYTFVVQPTPGLPERYGLLYIPSTWTHHPDG